MSHPHLTEMILDALAARSGGTTAIELAKFLGLEEGHLVLRLRELEKDHKVEAFGKEFHSGRDEPEPVWRLKP